jgi:CMP-N,N'-diacetyllegionaminic acid synthase
MIAGKRILAIIPARGGSKGIPRKNLCTVGDIPLIAFSIAIARAITEIDRFVLSTEDAEIASTARNFGAQVPFLRPPELANDSTPMIDVVLHTLSSLSRDGEDYDFVCILQPTTPLRSPDSILQALSAIQATPNTDCCLALAPVVDLHPRRIRKIEHGYVVGYLGNNSDKESQQRQAHADDLAFRRCGTFYVSRVTSVLSKRSLFGEKIIPIIVNGPQSINIDSTFDLLLANALWHERTKYPELVPLEHSLASIIPNGLCFPTIPSIKINSGIL